MIELSTQKKWRPWQAFVLEVVALALLITVGSVMQVFWGWTGLILTELMFLVLAVGVTLIHRTPLREVFPMSVPTLREVIGVLILVVVGLLSSMILVFFALTLMPQSLGEIEYLSDFLSPDNQGALTSVFVIALLPAICEEALHRGAILSHLRSLKKDWLIILIMGIFFGLFHLSLSKLLSTAALGALLSYLMVKKNNIVLPMLLHFLNNLVPILFSFLGASDGTQATEALQSIPTIQILGSYLVVGCIAPLLLVLAMKLVDPDGHKGRRWLFAGVCSVAMLAGGIALLAGGIACEVPAL